MDKNITSKRIAVIGAGQMGSGIAQVFATAKFMVKVCDINAQILEKSKERIDESLGKLYSKQKLLEIPDIIERRLSYCTNIADLAGSDVIIESAFENFQTKSNILYELAKYVTPQTYVASNTSSYSITSLSQMLPYPEQFLGFHFMNPPPLMELIEVIRGCYTSEETAKFFWDLAKMLGKYPIYSRNTPGFVLNRILIPMINEAIFVVYNNISTPEEIDMAMKLGANHPIGPLALADLIGLDTVLAIMQTLHKELGDDKYAPCPLLENYVKKGLLGRKSKKGFFEY